MKKMLLFLLIISGLSFSSVTGMLTKSGTGIFLASRVMNIDSDLNDYIDPGFAISFEYVMDSGIDIALSYTIESGFISGYNPLSLQASFHLSDNFYVGMSFVDFTDDSDMGLDTKQIHIASYTDDKAYCGLAYNIDSEDFAIEFGKLWNMNGMVLGGSYVANIEDLDLGFINVTLGTVF